MKLPQRLHFCQRKVRTLVTYTPKFGRQQPPFNILFFGSDAFALQTLTALHNSQTSSSIDHRPKLVNKLDVVSTSKKTPVAVFAKQHHLTLLKWPLDLHRLDPYDLGVLVSFGRLVPSKVISRMPYGILNVHPSLLPRWRGAAPILHTVLNRDTSTGVTVMSIQPSRFDTGPLLMQRKVPVPPDTSASTLADILAREGASLLMSCLRQMPDILSSARVQSSEGVTYAHKASPAMSVIDWSHQTVDQITLQHRALGSLFALRTTWQDRVLKLSDMVSSDQVLSSVDRGIEQETGSVAYNPQLNAVCVKCSDGWVAFKTVVYKKQMSAADFYNGYLSKHKFKDVRFGSQDNGLFGDRYRSWVLSPKEKIS